MWNESIPRESRPSEAGAIEASAIEPTLGDITWPTSRRNSDADLVLAAVERMQAAIDRERSAVDCLHAELSAMAQAIARAKIAIRSAAVKANAADGAAAFDTVVLLEELEHRVDWMLEIASRSTEHKAPPQGQLATETSTERQIAPEVEPKIEPQVEPKIEPEVELKINDESEPEVEALRVPTVSDVVSRLTRPADEQLAPAPVASAAASPRNEALMLEAMVQALSALDAADYRPRSTRGVRTDSMPLADAFQQSRAGTRADPLAPLHAMSAEEKIALFS
jgi:hypothetical protein